MEEDGGERSSFVVGLIENRAKEVGLSALDLRTASLHLSQYIETSSSYQNTKTLLHFYDPMTIIVTPNKMSPDGMIGISELVDRHYASSKKILMARGCFDDTKGATLVKSLSAKEPSVLGLDTYSKQYYLCLAAAAATIKWIEAEKGVIITSHSLSVTFNGSYDHMNIDATSVQNLEIIEPLHSSLWGTSNRKRSLFHMLKTTKNYWRVPNMPCFILNILRSLHLSSQRIAGAEINSVRHQTYPFHFRAKLLRANMLQPLKDIETINARLDSLDELMNNEELFFGLSQVLRKFPKETDRILCHFCFKTKTVSTGVGGANNARKSQALVASIILLKTALEALPFLSKVLKDAKSPLLFNIYKSVCQNAKYAEIRKRIEEVIDEDILHARVPFVARTQQCFAVKAGIDGLLDVSRRSFCDTSEAIHSLATKYREEFKLPNLRMPFNSRQGFYFSIPQKDVNSKLPKTFIQVLKHGKNFHCSTLELSSLNVRNKSAAAECFMRTEVCLEGLIDVIREDVSVLTLLAEVLCLLDMIVNSFAHVISSRPIDRYTRPEFTDNGPMAIDAGRHPVLENIHNDFVPNNIFLSEAANMVLVMGPNMSLIVMDELGRATSSADGFAIAWSCCEHLLSLKAYTIFATHMESLSELATIYPNIKVLHFHVEVKNDKLDFKFELKDGITRIPHYGLMLAGVAGLPTSVIETARSIAARISEMEIKRMEVNCAQYQSIKMAYRVAQRLICLKYSNQDEDGIRKALQNLKESYMDGSLW